MTNTVYTAHKSSAPVVRYGVWSHTIPSIFSFFSDALIILFLRKTKVICIRDTVRAAFDGMLGRDSD